MKAERPVTITDKALYSVEESIGLLGLSRQTLYNELNSGRLASFKVGKRRVIPSEAIQEWKKRMLEDAA